MTIDYLVRGGPAATALLDHKALLYGSEDELVNTAGPFLEEGVDRSEAVLAVTTKQNIGLLRRQLGPAGKRVDFVESAAFLTTPSSALERFREFGHAKLEDGAPWIRILGEPIWTGRSDEEIRLWTRVESLFNLVFATWPMTALCPYDERTVQPEITRQACLTHPQIVGREDLTGSGDYPGPGGLILEPGH